MATNGKLELVVRSRKVLARVSGFDVSFRGVDGLEHISRKTVNVFDYILDESQCRAVEEARALAARSGLALEVVDLTRQGLLARLPGFGSGGIRLRPLRTAATPLGLRETKTEPQRKGEVMRVACQT